MFVKVGRTPDLEGASALSTAAGNQAFEQPELFVDEVRTFFRKMRS
jgi:hypothetical protein